MEAALGFVGGWTVIVCLLVRLVWLDRHQVDVDLDVEVLHEKIRRLERDCADDEIVDSLGNSYYRPELAIVLASEPKQVGGVSLEAWRTLRKAEMRKYLPPCRHPKVVTMGNYDGIWTQCSICGTVLSELHGNAGQWHTHDWTDVTMLGRQEDGGYVGTVCRTCGKPDRLVPPT